MRAVLCGIILGSTASVGKFLVLPMVLQLCEVNSPLLYHHNFSYLGITTKKKIELKGIFYSLHLLLGLMLCLLVCVMVILPDC